MRGWVRGTGFRVTGEAILSRGRWNRGPGDAPGKALGLDLRASLEEGQARSAQAAETVQDEDGGGTSRRAVLTVGSGSDSELPGSPRQREQGGTRSDFRCSRLLRRDRWVAGARADAAEPEEAEAAVSGQWLRGAEQGKMERVAGQGWALKVLSAGPGHERQ